MMLRFVLPLLAALMSVAPAKAQSYPARQVTIVVPFAAGGGSDLLARLDIENDTSGNDYRALRIAIGSGGTIRMCEPSVNASGDPRKC